MSKEAVRAALVDLTKGLVLGPLAVDELLSSNPSDTYLTGILWPRDTEIDAIEDDGDGNSLADDDSDSAEHSIPGYRAIRPCAIGLTCTFDSEATVTISLEGTARYQPEAREVREAEEDASAASRTRSDCDWRRVPLRHRIVILPGESRTQWRTHEFLSPDGKTFVDDTTALDIKRRVDGRKITLTATLINTATRPAKYELSDLANLFQAGLQVTAEVAGKPAIQARRSQFRSDDEDALSNNLLYRDVREFAVGHGVSADWTDAGDMLVSSVSTSWFPQIRVPGTDPNGHEKLRALRASSVNPFAAAVLARIERRAEVCGALREFVALYGAWISSDLEQRLPQFSGDHRKAADANLQRCRETLARLQRGIEVLATDETVWKAFALANAAMDMQAQFPAKAERASTLIWRPFQLAFLLLVIPSLAYPAEEPVSRSCVDLLWFPTGGGKTEAYLALSAFLIFLRRLRHEQRREQGGVDVLMRYTLRLLTVQQLQRATALIAACELIREKSPQQLGTARITIGLYAGGDATPNRIEDAVSRLAEEKDGAKPLSTPRQLLECPVCGSKLPVSAYSIPEGSVEMRIICPTKSCPTGGRPLPVMTVDDVLYAAPPSLLIGTVDKFAQLPRRDDIRVLFGLDTDLRPSLIIQDELHLISGPLGSMVGLYEAAVDYLCTLDGIPPKIVGSTATIGRAATQVRALFDRSVLQFPPPGFDASDSFFAIEDRDGPDRRYIGIASAGRSPKFTLQAVLAAVSQCIASIRQKGGASDNDADPYWTCVAYFNSLRELGGAVVLAMDDVPRQMRFLAARLGTDRRVFEDYAKELSGRVSSRDIPQLLIDLGQSLGSDDAFAPSPVDLVLASNMISVGVDVPRLGLMVVNGQPKSTAEYIQASSRVGRGIPGLVLTIYNFGRPRDLSHFEHFRTYHGALYRSVEATSVTPWAPRARDKALPAVFIALARNLIAGLLGQKDGIRFDPDHPQVSAIFEYLIRRAAIATNGLEGADTERDLREVIRVWGRKAREARSAGKKINYWEVPSPFGNTTPALMYSAEAGQRVGGSGWATPNSMREVEPPTAFVWKVIPRKEASPNEES